MTLGENGIFNKAKYAKEQYEIATIKEEIQTEILAKQVGNEGKISDSSLKVILEKYGTINYEEDGTTIKSITTTEGGYEISIADIWTGTTVTVIADGSFNGTLHTPKIEGTGLIAVYWDEDTSEWVDLTESSSQEEWDNWYNYADTSQEGAGTSKWANARSKDGSMWVWIPRYEYKIDSTNQTIDVKFIEIGATTTTGYILHPAFSNEIENGGWSSDLPGFWVAKYEAGFQNSTVGEETKIVEYSDLKYTTVDSSYTTNFLGTITVDTTALSYPVFKANTYAYNLISVGDAWLISQEIDTASMYGLSNVDSHMLKNSEWGAVAYLTHSKYGVNGNSTDMNEVTANRKNMNDTTKNVYAVTSYGENDTPNDVNASSTKNMTGVFDLNGGTWERVAGFLQGGAASTPAWHNAMATSSTTSSSKYLTLYTANDKLGDATNETSRWNSDNYYFLTSGFPVFVRGGGCSNGVETGVFALSVTEGFPVYAGGFRACLAF